MGRPKKKVNENNNVEPQSEQSKSVKKNNNNNNKKKTSGKNTTSQGQGSAANPTANLTPTSGGSSSPLSSSPPSTLFAHASSLPTPAALPFEESTLEPAQTLPTLSGSATLSMDAFLEDSLSNPQVSTQPLTDRKLKLPVVNQHSIEEVKQKAQHSMTSCVGTCPEWEQDMQRRRQTQERELDVLDRIRQKLFGANQQNQQSSSLNQSQEASLPTNDFLPLPDDFSEATPRTQLLSAQDAPPTNDPALRPIFQRQIMQQKRRQTFEPPENVIKVVYQNSQQAPQRAIAHSALSENEEDEEAKKRRVSTSTNYDESHDRLDSGGAPRNTQNSNPPPQLATIFNLPQYKYLFHMTDHQLQLSVHKFLSENNRELAAKIEQFRTWRQKNPNSHINPQTPLSSEPLPEASDFY